MGIDAPPRSTNRAFSIGPQRAEGRGPERKLLGAVPHADVGGSGITILHRCLSVVDVKSWRGFAFGGFGRTDQHTRRGRDRCERGPVYGA